MLMIVSVLVYVAGICLLIECIRACCVPFLSVIVLQCVLCMLYVPSNMQYAVSVLAGCLLTCSTLCLCLQGV